MPPWLRCWAWWYARAVWIACSSSFLSAGVARLETCVEVIYWVNTTDLSLPDRRLLVEWVEGLGAMA